MQDQLACDSTHERGQSSSPAENREILKREIKEFLSEHEEGIWQIVRRNLSMVEDVKEETIEAGKMCSLFSSILVQALAEIFHVAYDDWEKTSFIIDQALGHVWITFLFEGSPALSIDPTYVQLDRKYANRIRVKDVPASDPLPEMRWKNPKSITPAIIAAMERATEEIIVISPAQQEFQLKGDDIPFDIIQGLLIIPPAPRFNRFSHLVFSRIAPIYIPLFRDTY